MRIFNNGILPYIFVGLIASLLSSPSYAEVSDKIPSWSQMLVEASLLSLLGFICLLTRSRWSYIILPAILIFSSLTFISDVNDSHFMNSIIAEQGKNYIFFRWHGSFIMCVVSMMIAYGISVPPSQP